MPIITPTIVNRSPQNLVFTSEEGSSNVKYSGECEFQIELSFDEKRDIPIDVKISLLPLLPAFFRINKNFHKRVTKTFKEVVHGDTIQIKFKISKMNGCENTPVLMVSVRPLDVTNDINGDRITSQEWNYDCV